ncbi:hypothetical protein CRH09_30805 [Nocardia terpenica]|uniref:Uncharacterized protein n=1 Tax=Nocardia terpenica TaxID=455432 RepID=A0A291RRQ1_9NOCA|nr:hypothetical protein CRH09_30805 [Nocardia terpenica]
MQVQLTETPFQVCYYLKFRGSLKRSEMRTTKMQRERALTTSLPFAVLPNPFQYLATISAGGEADHHSLATVLQSLTDRFIDPIVRGLLVRKRVASMVVVVPATEPVKRFGFGQKYFQCRRDVRSDTNAIEHCVASEPMILGRELRACWCAA